MEKINFEDGELVKKGYVEIDGKQYSVEEAEYKGTTPLSAFVMNKLQDNVENEIKNIVNNKSIIELVGTDEKPIDADDIKSVGIYKVSGEHTNFFDDRANNFILQVAFDRTKLVQSVIIEQGICMRTATYEIIDQEIYWIFGEWTIPNVLEYEVIEEF